MSDRNVLDQGSCGRFFGTEYYPENNKKSDSFWNPQDNVAAYFWGHLNPVSARSKNYYVSEILNPFSEQVCNIDSIIMQAEKNGDYSLASNMAEAQNYFFICSCSKQRNTPEDRHNRMEEMKRKAVLQQVVSSFPKNDENPMTAFNKPVFNQPNLKY